MCVQASLRIECAATANSTDVTAHATARAHMSHQLPFICRIVGHVKKGVL